MPLIGRIVDHDFPFLGCCYGVGTLGSVVGATVDRTYPEPVGALTVTLTEQGRRDPLFADLPDVFDAYGGHKEGASALPSGLPSLAYSADCPIQAFRVGDDVYATQFHPELDAGGICTRIDVYKDYGYFAPETAESLKSLHSNGASNTRRRSCGGSPAIHPTGVTTRGAMGSRPPGPSNDPEDRPRQEARRCDADALPRSVMTDTVTGKLTMLNCCATD